MNEFTQRIGVLSPSVAHSGRRAHPRERGDVPGWVLITLMNGV
jgi:hypothetical protein